MTITLAPYFREHVEFVLQEPMREHGFLLADARQCKPLLEVNGLAFIDARSFPSGKSREGPEDFTLDSYTAYACFCRGDIFVALAQHVSLEFHVLAGVVHGTNLLPAGAYRDITETLKERDKTLSFLFDGPDSLRQTCRRLAAGPLSEFLHSVGSDSSFAKGLDEEYRAWVTYYVEQAKKEDISDAMRRAESAFKSRHYAEVVSILNSLPAASLSGTDKKRLEVARKRAPFRPESGKSRTKSK